MLVLLIINNYSPKKVLLIPSYPLTNACFPKSIIPVLLLTRLMIDWSVAVELLIPKVLNYATSFLFPWRHILEYIFEKEEPNYNFHISPYNYCQFPWYPQIRLCDVIKTEIIVITTANQNKGKYHKEPVRTWDEKKNSGKRAWC